MTAGPRRIIRVRRRGRTEAVRGLPEFDPGGLGVLLPKNFASVARWPLTRAVKAIARLRSIIPRQDDL
jgi:hypothetical protein